MRRRSPRNTRPIARQRDSSGRSLHVADGHSRRSLPRPSVLELRRRAAQNAQQSTGPRTSEGKARSAQNARRHGLTLSAAGDPAWSDEIKTLARSIAGADADPARYELACRIAEAQIDVMRARRARTDLYAAFYAALGERDGTVRLAAVFDYEWRALARRKRAIRAFDAHDDHVSGERTEPNQSR